MSIMALCLTWNLCVVSTLKSSETLLAVKHFYTTSTGVLERRNRRFTKSFRKDCYQGRLSKRQTLPTVNRARIDV